MFSPGEVLVYSGSTPISQLIEWGTCSRYSHVSVVADIALDDLCGKRPRRRWSPALELLTSWIDDCYIVESTTLNAKPCVVQGIPFQGVQVHRLDSLQSYDGQVCVMRLREPLGPPESRRLTERLLDLVGTPYREIGAVLAGTKLLRHIWRRDRAYCVGTVCSALEYALVDHDDMPDDLDPVALSPKELVRVLVDCGLYSPPEVIR